MGRTTGTKQDLAGRGFLTHCPPDVPPRHRIVALLGTTDLDDASRPRDDGWFVSDFYLFHHLLAPQFPRPPNQVWLTCEDPGFLVQEYGEYVHEVSTSFTQVKTDGNSHS
ncbi:uncharacterized protein N7515_000759 [Penicillium bovifimosum]|uniref:Uncharacterized protein n=1 Tax=Penicillium bovifimosum TaxID=126998 RepID=A0A9W9HG02_9EURO|nr:uncharacterized protein N7515_000759 [Penicillium bovifimosum]KAJ5146195.1 hypothetical protein N7515_000759 [Penicillium bovifimosum]